ncbi:hypothetical protein CDAR_94091 [Caerostris darwini]|uniref:Uncharacterized protein n=1 Tax=Caerostris darwini TaxID=1538125 RepID=A0AAV4NMS5_9ARAC|nr:hypothetical protein CDAR_94091 [Caerostris darwini]
MHSPPRRACYATGATQSGEKTKRGFPSRSAGRSLNCHKLGWLSPPYTQEAEHHFEPRSLSLEKSTCCPQGKHPRSLAPTEAPLTPAAEREMSEACGGSKPRRSTFRVFAP